MKRYHWTLLLLFTLIGSLADGIIGSITISTLLQANNPISATLAITGGFLLTGFAMATKIMLEKETPLTIKLLWFVSAFIDAGTTVVGLIYYIIPDNPTDFMIALAIALSTLISGSSMVSLYVYEKVMQSYE